MAINSITAANATLMLSVAGLFNTPVQITGFDVDDVYDVEGIENAETKMGVDGTLSAGFIFVPIKQNFTIQADSASVAFFEAWYAAEQQKAEKYWASGTTTLPGISRVYQSLQGVLSNYSPLSSAKKVLQPRKFMITWQSVTGAPV